MSTVKILRRGDDMIAEVVRLLQPRSDDLDRCLAVFPGKRPAHFVRKRIAEERTTGYLAPPVISYDELIEMLTRRLGIAGPALDPLDAAALLFEIHRSQNEALGGHFASFEEFLPLGFRLFEEFEELTLANLSEREIDESVGGISFGRRHALATYYKEFVRATGERDLLSRAARLRLAAERFDEIDWSGFRTIILAGFYALAPGDQLLFRRFLALDQVTALFQEGPGLDRQLGWVEGPITRPDDSDPAQPQMDLFTVPGDGGKTAGAVQEVRLYKASDLHGQVFALSAMIESLNRREGPPDERTVIVLPSSEALFPVVQQTLPLLPDDGYNISLGYPLSRTPLYAFLGSLLDLAATAREGTLQAAAYQHLVLHPYVKNIRYGTRPDVTRVLFHVIEEILAGRPATAVRLEDLEENERVFDRVAAAFADEHIAVSKANVREHLKMVHDLVIRPFLPGGTLRMFAERIMAVIRVIGERSDAHLHPLFRRSAERFVEIAERITRSLAADQEFSSPATAAMFLQSLFASQTVPFPGTPLGGLQVLGLLETRNLSFDRVIVLDAIDGNIPGSGGIERLVPQGIRKKLGLETSQDRERLIEYYFNVLLSNAKEVHLFFREERNEELSRFIQKLQWRREQAGAGRADDPVQQVRYAIHLANPPTPAVPKPEGHGSFMRDFEFSARALDTYLQCPLRFHHEYILGLRERDEVEEEVEQYAVGTIVHDILKEFFEPVVGRSLTQADLDPARMDALTEKAFRVTLGDNLKGASLLLKRQTLGRLREFLHDYQEQILKMGEVRIHGVEQKVSVMRDGHRFTGRIDRIEQRGDKVHILDYKVRQDDVPYKVQWKKFSADDPETWPEAIGSIQLPLYAMLYAGTTETPLNGVVPKYVFLGRNQLTKDIETGISEDGSGLEDLERVILGLVRQIKDPKTPFEPTKDQKKNCPGCPYQVMCGTQWAREGRW